MEFIDDIELSRIISVPAATLRRWRFDKTGPRYYKFGGLVKYDKDEVLAWIQEQSVITGNKSVNEAPERAPRAQKVHYQDFLGYPQCGRNRGSGRLTKDVGEVNCGQCLRSLHAHSDDGFLGVSHPLEH